MKMKALYVNHNDETFAELTHGQVLDVIFNADNAEMYVLMVQLLPRNLW